jgi:Ca2+-transporting ATPase
LDDADPFGRLHVNGLSEAEAARLLAEVGRNELTGSGLRSPWRIVWEQLTGLMMLVLMVAAGVSAALGDYADAVAIGAIVVLNAVLGFTQEYRAEAAMAALKKMAVPMVRVRRAGAVREISALLLVPGDVALVEAGNFISADGRVVESAGLQVQESALTGESESILKAAEDEVFRGTFVTAGRGEAVVTATGMRTELGRIATMIQKVKATVTPLQKRLDHLARRLAAAALALVGVIFLLGLWRGDELRLLFLTAVSIGVAAVPEGLPAVVTIALALGAQRMLRRKVLIRKLSAVETLGSVSVICTDKTGTLTENRMTVEILQAPDGGAEFGVMLAGAALCSDVVGAVGDPTEIAMVVAAEKAGFVKTELDRAMPRVAEVGFSSERKRMTTVHRMAGEAGVLSAAAGGADYLVCTKGSVDGLLGLSVAVWVGGKAEPMSVEWRDRLAKQNAALAARGMRVLGVAFRGVDSLEAMDEFEQGLTFAGMVGIADPLRAEAAGAMDKCRAAGIRPVMITGDHPLTAASIGAQLGLDTRRVVTGAELEKMSVTELEGIVGTVQVYARVSPEHKLKIVTALQARGAVIAMTGDGVNDAPALRKADIGVAMGKSGTDVAKEAADMVLLDDSFASIVAAVGEGRAIYDNIRKFIRYILATNSGEIGVMVIAPFLGMPLPLLPLQILWMNLVTDGLPALALGVEPAEADTMQRAPVDAGESVFARGLGRHVIWVGLLMTALSLGSGYWYFRAGDPKWQTLLFTTMTFAQMAHIMAIRSERRWLFEVGLFSNLPLLGAVALTLGLQFALVYVPFLQGIFKTRALGFGDVGLAVGLSLVLFFAVEAEKKLRG